jgi:thiosulfate dehydrogenase (quinone) large subunit
MSENKENQCCQASCDQTLAFWVLRAWLAVRAILTGVEKYGVYKSVQRPVIDPTTGQPDASGVMHSVDIKFYATSNYSGIPGPLKDKFANEPLLLPAAAHLFDHLLGPLLIASGVMLLLGVATRLSLFVQGLIYTMLTFGLILIHEDAGISWLGIHVGLVALALTLAKHNKFALLKKW